MTYEEMFKAALKRPKNYYKLDPKEQFDVDTNLHILSWVGPKTAEEVKVLAKHHGMSSFDYEWWELTRRKHSRIGRI